MNIVFYDHDILVCLKSAGEVSEGDGKKALPTILSEALCALGEENTDIFPVHRLDKETTGIMVFARNRNAAATLCSKIANGEFHKEYIARIHGVPEKSEDTLKDILFFDRKRCKSFVVDRPRKGTKEAILHYSVINSENGISTLKIQLYTGRTHQIRVQFASRGMPLVGDRRYGAPKTDGESLSLTAWKISFTHPSSNEALCFTFDEASEGGLKQSECSRV